MSNVCKREIDNSICIRIITFDLFAEACRHEADTNAN